MAVIPLAHARPTLDVPGTPTPPVVNSAAAEFGRLGQALVDLSAGWEQTQNINAEAAFQNFKLSETKAYDDAAYNLKPADAQGFAEGYDTAFQQRGAKWVADNTAGMTPKSAGYWQGRIGDLRLQLFNNAIGKERQDQGTFAAQQLDQGFQQTILPRAAEIAKLPDSPEKAAALADLENDAFRLVDASALPPAAKDEAKIKARGDIHTTFATGLPPSEKARLDPTRPDETFVDRTLQIEGTGKNPNSSAVGPGQFIDATWLDLIKRYRPDLATGRTDREILALRTSDIAPQLGQEMTRAYAAENAAYLKYNQIDTTAGNLYLAHFLGPQGAVEMLSASPDAIAAEVNPKAAKANPRVFYHVTRGGPDYDSPKTVAEVTQWAGALQGGVYHNDWGRVLDAIPFDQRVNLGADGAKDFLAQQTATSAAAKKAYDQRLNDTLNAAMDGTYGFANLASDYADGQGWLNDAGDRKKVYDTIVAANKDTLQLSAAQALMQDATTPINRFDGDQQKLVNLWYDKLGGRGDDLYEPDGSGVQTLRAVVARSQIIPDSAKSQLLSGIYSPDAGRRSRAFTIMDGLSRSDPAAYALTFSEEARKRVDIYQRLAPIVPPEVLAEEMNPMVTPIQQALREKRRAEGEALARKNISDGDILGVFDTKPGGWWNPAAWGGSPSISNDPLAMGALRQDYENAYAEAYARVPSEDSARALANKWVQIKWGVTDVGSGGGILMAYPPQRYYAAVEGGHDWMDTQLEQAVRAQFPRAQSWSLISDEQTEGDVAVGAQPAYSVMVVDETGAYKMLGTPMAAGDPNHRRIAFSAVPAHVRFDDRKAMSEAEARFMQKRAAAQGTAQPAQPPADSGNWMDQMGKTDPARRYIGQPLENWLRSFGQQPPPKSTP